MWECKGEAVSEREHLLCYLEWQCPEVQSEVQQESRKKSGDLCARWHRGINFLTKLSPTIKPKSMPKSPKRDLKNNTFTRQHSHLFFFPYKGQADSSNPMMRKKIECLRIFICTLCGINFYLWLIFFFYSGIFHSITLPSIQTAACMWEQQRAAQLSGYKASHLWFCFFFKPFLFLWVAIFLCNFIHRDPQLTLTKKINSSNNNNANCRSGSCAGTWRQ